MAEKINNEEYNPDLINLVDDDGKEYNFEVIDAIETDEARYLALLPIYDDPKKMLEDSGELVIVKVGEENGEDVYSPLASKIYYNGEFMDLSDFRTPPAE